jgi:replicative superfamily II helicase
MVVLLKAMHEMMETQRDCLTSRMDIHQAEMRASHKKIMAETRAW